MNLLNCPFNYARLYSKGGSTNGYRCMLIFFPQDGNGAIIMTNSDNGVKLIKPMLKKLGQIYGWLSYNNLDPLN